MMDPRDTAQQAERQARIQEDIRQLFARYRQPTHTDTRRFVSRAAHESATQVSGSTATTPVPAAPPPSP